MVLASGSAAPDFTARDQHDRAVTLEDLRGRFNVLYFYPKDDTPVCTIEACTFQEQLADFKALDVPVYGVSADSVGSHRRFAERHGLAFPLLSDPERRMIAAYEASGILGRTSRITYIIGPDLTIQGAHRAEFAGRKHVAWAQAEIARVSAPAGARGPATSPRSDPPAKKRT